MQTPSVSVNGTTIHYQSRGDGNALVLLHGFPLDSRIFEKQLGGLSDIARVITIDLRGFGKSASNDSFTIESLADDVHAVLMKIGATPCVLGGLSMGGYVALRFAKKYPTCLNGLILLDTKAEADTPQAKQGREKMIQLVRASGSKAIAEEMLGKMLSEQTIRTQPNVVREVRDIMESCPPKTIEHALEALRDRPDSCEMLPSIPVPTLILVGDADAITPPAVSKTMHDAIPNSKLVIVPGAGHLTSLEQPAAVNDAIRAFLKSL